MFTFVPSTTVPKKSRFDYYTTNPNEMFSSGFEPRPLLKRLLSLFSQATFGMIAYNDQYPESLSADPLLSVPQSWGGGAHAKGVIGLGPEKGFWLVHSMPQFPGNF
jgi:hypothetical protein